MSSITGHSAVEQPPGPSGGSTRGRRRLGDTLFAGAAGASGLIVIAIVALTAIFLATRAIPSLLDDKVDFLTSTQWQAEPGDLRFGILQILWTTVSISLIAMIIAIPVGVCVALFLTQYAPRWLARPAAGVIDLLAAIPSIVYGLWGIQTFAPHVTGLQNWLNDVLGSTWLFTGPVSTGTVFIAGIVLSIMVLPIITALSREVFAQTPAANKEGALALGATKWEMIRTAVLPFGRAGVVSAAMLGLGRALGETIAITIIVSSVSSGTDFFLSVLQGGETFASKIANNAAEFNNPESTGAYIAAGLVLFILTFVVNAIARVIVNRRKAFS
ncbi:MAG: phosphate ABC transporter permease subunit PstC [Janthinobacterium lividum]